MLPRSHLNTETVCRAEEAFYSDAGIYKGYPGYLNYIIYNECKATEKVSLLTKNRREGLQ